MSFNHMFAIAAFATGAMFPALGAHSKTFKTLYSFQGGPDGGNPVSGLLYRGGSLYGTTQQGGLYGDDPGGIVFRMNPSTGAETVIFNSQHGYFQSALSGPGKNIYGTTYYGGLRYLGTVFRINTITGKEDLLYSFTGGTDGSAPIGALVYEGGALYGATEGGGAFGKGNVFKVVPSTGALTVLHSFAGGADAQCPCAGVIYHAGVLYGTTSFGGTADQGTVFKVDVSTGVETVLYSFGSDPRVNPPTSELIYQGGVLYGATGGGGYGTVFKIDPKTRVYTVVTSFDSTIGGNFVTKLLYHAGALYGANASGGRFHSGVIFKVDLATGAATILHTFFGGAGGPNPVSELIYQSGIFYGTTFGFGRGYGTVYSLTP